MSRHRWVPLLGLAVGFVVPFAVHAVCRGDCDGSGSVSVDEVLVGLGAALGESDVALCPAADLDGGGSVTVDEVGAAISDTLSGCPTPPFVEFAWEPTLADPRSDRLCVEAADPDRAPDTTFIDCRVEGASFAPDEVPPKDELVVVAYNIERGFQVDRQLAAIAAGDIPAPDVLLLSEADRGCRRTNFRNVARDYAEALGFYFVYATEFVELPNGRGLDGPYDPPICEHGNAIVSRYPLGNVRQIRHAQNFKWYKPPSELNADEPRLGGRVAIAADMRVGERLVRLYVLHLESTLSALRIQNAQAVEIARDAERVPYPVIVGGDLNPPFATFDILNGTRRDGTTQAFLTRGYRDAHAGLTHAERATIFDPVPLIIDFVFTRGVALRDAGLCPAERCGSLSDHLPLWATVGWVGP